MVKRRFTTRGINTMRRVAKEQHASRKAKYLKWYTLPIWAELRKAQLQNEPECEICIMEGVAPVCAIPKKPHVDHREAHRGNWLKFIDPDNLRTLCHSHHSQKTASEDGGFGNMKIGE